MRKYGVFILVLIFGLQQLHCMNSPDTSSAGSLGMRFRNISFLRNNEYSNPITEGYTLIGYFIQPELVYSPSDRLKLSLGIHLLQFSGTNGFHLVKPVFTSSFNLTGNMVFTMGTLPGSDSHRMFDPHFSKERLYNAFAEDGLELRFLNDHFFNDVWLSWENFIFRGDNEREIFTAGESFSYSSEKIGKSIRIRIPVQMMFKHYGGQISDYPEKVETYFNLAAGAGLSYDIADRDFGETGIEAVFYYGKSLTGKPPSGIGRGTGAWYKIRYTYRASEIDAGLWTSDDFFAPNGNYIFGSVSDHLHNYVIHRRRLLTCSASIRLVHKSFLEFFLGFEGFWDTDLRRFDNAVSLHLRFDKLFSLARLKDQR